MENAAPSGKHGCEGVNTPFVAAKQKQAILEQEYREAGAALKSFPGSGSGVLGLTPDAVRELPEWQSAKRRHDTAFSSLRDFNAAFVKAFHKELRAERRAQLRGMRTDK
ncbi:hypothetical protein GCM10011491_41500 [Brucella endophytica]|uniref:Uncharacterized protein n=1 Tax=Brucella endophytica TaxID=1963359 RepID=A0A916SNH4_9HYPH|nr:hypothetical protein [Brucella endophytica]GGB09241.1 hypothetical protein GCM10011491_41500 [Brucella endophytica]